MRRLYRYRGTVGVMSAMGQTAEEITLYDSSDDRQGPHAAQYLRGPCQVHL